MTRLVNAVILTASAFVTALVFGGPVVLASAVANTPDTVEVTWTVPDDHGPEVDESWFPQALGANGQTCQTDRYRADTPEQRAAVDAITADGRLDYGEDAPVLVSAAVHDCQLAQTGMPLLGWAGIGAVLLAAGAGGVWLARHLGQQGPSKEVAA